jgi:hypothetical protein
VKTERNNWTQTIRKFPGSSERIYDKKGSETSDKPLKRENSRTEIDKEKKTDQSKDNGSGDSKLKSSDMILWNFLLSQIKFYYTGSSGFWCRVSLQTSQRLQCILLWKQIKVHV